MARTTADDPSDPPDPFADEDDSGGDPEDSDPADAADSSSTFSSSSGSRTTAPDPSDPPDPDPEDTVTGGDDGAQPEPTDPDDQVAEGGEASDDSGTSGERTTADDPSDPPDPEPEDVLTDPPEAPGPDQIDDDLISGETPTTERGQEIAQEQRQNLAEQIESETGLSIDPQDLVTRRQDGQILTQVPASALAEAQREQLAGRLEDQFGADVDPEQLRSEREGDGVETQIPTDLRRSLQLEQAAQQSERFEASDLEFVQAEGPLDVQLTGSARRDLREDLTEDIEQDLARSLVSGEETREGPLPDLEQGEDFTVSGTVENLEGEFTDSFLKEQAAKDTSAFEPQDFVVEDGQARVKESALRDRAEQKFRETVSDEFGVPVSGFERGEQFEVSVEDGQASAELTAEGRKAVIGTVAAQEGELGGVEIVDLDQVTFDEEGRVENIDRRPIASGDAAGGGGLLEDVVFSGPLGFAATQPREAADALDEVRDASQAGVEFGTETLVTPAAAGFGDLFSARPAGVSSGEFDAQNNTVADLAAFRPAGVASGELEDVESGDVDTPAGRLAQGVGSGVLGVTVGLPGDLVTAGSTVGSGAAFSVQNPELAGTAAAAFTTKAVSDITTQAASNPVGFTGSLAGAAAAGTALSPVRLASTKVPRTGAGTKLPRPTKPDVDVDAPVSASKVESGDVPSGPVVFGRELGRTDTGLNVNVGSPVRRPQRTTVRALRLRDPLLFEKITGRTDTGTTLFGAKGARPTAGTPTVDAETIRFADLPGQGATTELIGGFETETLGASARAAGGQAARRFEASEGLIKQAQQAEAELELETTEDIVSEARAVPGSATGDIADALEDLGATVEGSAATKAQLGDAFRQPRDVDILIDDKAAAKSRLSEALEGEDAEVGDVFDIKERGERPRPGEFIKRGRTAEGRLETEGGEVTVTRVSEELTRKASAAAFLRGEGSPAPEFEGRTTAFDVGPEPARAGARPRFKDPADAASIARELDLSPAARRRFEAAFADEILEADRGPENLARAGFDADEGLALGDLADTLRLRDLAADETAQATLVGRGTGAGRFGVDASDLRRTDADTDADSAARRTDTDGETRRSPSPGRRADAESPGLGATGGSPGVSGGRDTDLGTSAPGVSPGEPDSPVSPAAGGGGGASSGVGADGLDSALGVGEDLESAAGVGGSGATSAGGVSDFDSTAIVSGGAQATGGTSGASAVDEATNTVSRGPASVPPTDRDDEGGEFEASVDQTRVNRFTTPIVDPGTVASGTTEDLEGDVEDAGVGFGVIGADTDAFVDEGGERSDSFLTDVSGTREPTSGELREIDDALNTDLEGEL